MLADLPDGIPVLATTATANAQGHLRRGRAAGHQRPGPARRARPRVAPPGRRAPQDRRAAAGLAGRPPRRVRGQRHRLLPDRRADTGDRHPSAVARTHGGCLLRPDRPDRTRGARGRPGHRPGEGAGGDQCPRHGLRRDPRFRRQHGSTPVAGRLLPAGRARRSRHRSGHRRTPAGARGPRHLEVLRLPRLPARGSGAPDAVGARGPGEAAEHGHHGDVRRSQPDPPRVDAEGARRGWRRSPGSGWLGVDRPGVGLRRRALPPGRRGARGRAAGDARLHRH